MTMVWQQNRKDSPKSVWKNDTSVCNRSCCHQFRCCLVSLKRPICNANSNEPRWRKALCCFHHKAWSLLILFRRCVKFWSPWPFEVWSLGRVHLLLVQPMSSGGAAGNELHGTHFVADWALQLVRCVVSIMELDMKWHEGTAKNAAVIACFICVLHPLENECPVHSSFRMF